MNIFGMYYVVVTKTNLGTTYQLGILGSDGLEQPFYLPPVLCRIKGGYCWLHGRHHVSARVVYQLYGCSVFDIQRFKPKSCLEKKNNLGITY